jgi:hypothetical protein
MAFIVPGALAPIVAEKPIYVSGYTPEEEERIKKAKALLDKRDLAKDPVTLLEFKTIVAPWYRINRVEEFILHPVKEKKVKAPKEPKVPKIKKLTKKQAAEKLSSIIFKLAIQDDLTDEERTWYKEHTGGEI